MSDEGRFVSRREVYDLVWQVPIAELAARWGGNAAGLADVCRKLNVPIPGPEHWDLVQKGQPVERTPLPPPERGMPIGTCVHEPRKEQAAAPAPAAPKEPPKERPKVDVPKDFGNAHSLVTQTRRALTTKTRLRNGLVETDSRLRQPLTVLVSQEQLDRAFGALPGLGSTGLACNGSYAGLSRDPKPMDQVTKDVSAMANSAGGMLIYGVAEHPGTQKLSFDPVDVSAFPREWLEQVVSQVNPRIPGLQIFPVHVGPADNQCVYVLDIPQGTTAHQARDLRYYRRYNFQSVAMYDHEVRDVMSRTKHPRLGIKPEVVVYPYRNDDGNDGVLAVRITNESDVFARYVSVVVDAPPRVAGKVIFYRDSSYDEPATGARYHLSFSNHLGPPLFPKAVLIKLFPFIFVTLHGRAPERELDRFKIVAFADAMPRQTHVFAPEDILVNKSGP